MTLYVNNRTAMRFWCMVAASLDGVSSACTITEVKAASTTLGGFSAQDIEGLVGEARKLHVLVESASRRSRSPRIVYHVRTTPYPAGAFRRYSSDILVASPELTFFEMANELPFFKLVEFGYLLCGTYTLNPSASTLNDKTPLSTKRRLASFIRKMGTARGCAVAKRALDQVIEGSASVRETKLAILLCTSVRHGGYGFPKPVLNYKIEFSEKERAMFGKPYVVVDLYWPDFHFGIEYDGREYHSEEADVSRDRRKGNELNYKGIEVLRVDRRQIANPYQVSVLAEICARKLGVRMRKPTPQQLANRNKLFNDVMR